MKKIISLICLAGLICVIGCTGGPKATGNTSKAGTGAGDNGTAKETK